ncbi:MAG: helicase-associated domain-containing protein [Ardenticatenaceae bacterium]
MIQRLPRYFDDYLPNINVKELKRMARLWGGLHLTRKADFIGIIKAGLRDPFKVRQVVAQLTPFERDALGWLKKLGGKVEPSHLFFGLRASGIPVPEPEVRSYHREESKTLCVPLVKRGLLLVDSAREPAYLSDFGHVKVFSDDRLLAAVDEPQCRPLLLNPSVSPEGSIFRPAPTVMLDMIGFLQAIEDNHGVRLTKSGTIRVGDLRKLSRSRGWQLEDTPINGMPFPTLALAFIKALRNVGLLTSKGQILQLKESGSEFAKRPYTEQVDLLLQGFVLNEDWSESPKQNLYMSSERYIQARQALVMALTSLPIEGTGFFSFADFDQAIFERIGEHFSFRHTPRRPTSKHHTAQQLEVAYQVWRAKLREEWLKSEKKWIMRALSTWLYFFGIVELSMEGDWLTALRLTDLGRAVLHPELKLTLESSATEGTTWIIQPNFEILVYLHHTTPHQLAFLERHADRVSTQQFTAQYQLTRDSVYKALESGSTPEELLAGLKEGANHALPQNVGVEISEWAALRERMSLRRQATLIEYPDAASRQEALQEESIRGTPVGERFLLLTAQDDSTPFESLPRINYAKKLPKCLTVTEDGLLGLSRSSADLFLDQELARWAEQKSDTEWQLTQASVSAAIKSGLSRRSLLSLLKQRLMHRLPALLEVALRAWTSHNKPRVALETLTLLTCEQAVFDAIAGSAKLRPYLRGILPPDLIVVENDQIDALREQLQWLGLELTPQLGIKSWES